MHALESVSAWGWTASVALPHLVHGVVSAAVCLVALVLLATKLDERFLHIHLRQMPAVRRTGIAAFATLLLLNLFAVLAAEGSIVVVAVDLATCAAPVALLFAALHLREPRRPRPPEHSSVLVVGAHPDDIELGCGATLARLVDAGHEVHAIVLSRGSSGGAAAVRAKEALAGGALLALTTVDVLDFPDTRLATATGAMTQAIERGIRAHRPDLVLTHSPNDQHQDHAAAHLATIRAARRHHSILCYESPSATRDFDPSVFVDVAAYVEVKVAAVGMHRDQAGKPYMTADRVRGLASFRGQQARLVHAEAFEPVRLLHAFIGAVA